MVKKIRRSEGIKKSHTILEEHIVVAGLALGILTLDCANLEALVSIKDKERRREGKEEGRRGVK